MVELADASVLILAPTNPTVSNSLNLYVSQLIERFIASQVEGLSPIILRFPFDPVSLVRLSIINAGTDKDAQKKNGIPRLILARLLPRGGEATFPICIRVNTIPTAVPE